MADPLDKLIADYTARLERLRVEKQSAALFIKARWQVEEEILISLLEQVQTADTPLTEKKTLCSLLDEIFMRCEPKTLERTLRESTNKAAIVEQEHFFSRQEEIAISKANIQASEVMMRGMNYIREHALLFSKHPEIIQNIRGSELAVITAREYLRLSDKMNLLKRLTNLEVAILIHYAMLQKTEDWKQSFGTTLSNSQALEIAKQNAAEALIDEALFLQKRHHHIAPKSILAALEYLETRLDVIEDPVLAQYVQEKSCILLRQLQEAIRRTA